MNQVRIVDLPGLTVPDWVRGKRGFDLLSSQAMRQQVAIQAQQLGLNPDDPDLLPHFDDCLTAVSPQVRAVAQTIAQDYGRSLGYLLLTLKRGDAINRKARPDWQAAHWAYWQQINAVWLGGGLLSGNLGRVAVAMARTLIHDCGFSDFALELAQNGRYLPLVGIGRTAPPGTTAMLLFDFGQTAVKRAIALYQNDLLSQLILLPAVQPACDDVLRPSLAWADINQFADWLLKLMIETWRGAALIYPTLSPMIAVSMACYLLDGQPRPEDRGCYGRLQKITPNLAHFLSEKLRQQLHQDAHIQLYHDGIAAALPFAGFRQTAVLTLGTAIGVGFPPADHQLCSVSKTLALSSFPTV